MATKRSILAKIVRIMGIVLLSLVGLVLVLLVLLTLPPGEEFARSMMERQLTAALHQPVSIARFETNLLSNIQLAGLRIGTAGQDTSDVVRVTSLLVRYDLRPLLHNTIRIDEIAIDSIEIDIRRDRHGKFNLVILDSSAESSPEEPPHKGESNMRISLGDLKLTSLTLHADDRTLPAEVLVNGLSLAVRQPREGTYAFVMGSAEGMARYGKVSPSPLVLHAAGSWTEGMLDLDSLVVRAVNLTIAASGRIPVESKGELRASLAVRGDPALALDAAGEKAALPPIHVRGPIELTATASGTRALPDVRAKLIVPPLSVRQLTIAGGFLQGRWQGESVVVDSLLLQALDGSLSGTVEAALGEDPAANARLSIYHMDLGALWSTLFDTTSAYEGRLNGTITANGAGRAPEGWRALVDLRTSDLKYHAKEFPNLFLNGGLDAGNIRLNLEQGDVTASVAGKLEHDSLLSGTFSLDVPELGPMGDFINMPELSGALRASGSFSGTLSAPDVRVALEGENITYQYFPVDNVAARIHYARRKLIIEEAKIAGGLDSIDWKRPPFHLDSLAGGFHYAGEIAGPMTGLQGVMRVDLVRPRYGQYGLDMANLTVSIDSSQVINVDGGLHRGARVLAIRGGYDLEESRGTLLAQAPGALTDRPPDSLQAGGSPASVDSLAGVISAAFAMGKDRGVSLQASARDLDLREVGLMVLDTMRLDGRLAFDVRAGGSATNPHVVLRAAITQIVYDSLALDSIAVEGSLENHRLEIPRFSVEGLGQRLAASAAVELRPDSGGAYAVTSKSRIQGRASLPSFDLHLVQAVLSPGMSISGRTAMNLEWNGTVAHPRPSGTIRLDSMRFDPGNATGPVTLDLEGSVHDSLIKIDRAQGTLLQTPFTIDGSIVSPDWKQFAADMRLAFKGRGELEVKGKVSPDRLNMKARVDSLDLAMAQPFLSSVTNLAGVLNCDLTLEGTPSNPLPSGFMRAHGITFTPAMLDSTIRDGVINASFEGDNLRLDSLFARLGAGELLVHGTAARQEGALKDVNIAIDAHDLLFSSPDAFLIRLDSVRMSLTGGREGYLVDGRLRFGESRYIADVEPKMILANARSVEKVTPTTPTMMQKTRLRVQVRESDSLWIDNNVAKLRLHAELGIQGTAANPTFSGRLTVPEGDILYLDRRFAVKEGVVDFVDPHRFNPEINFNAETEVTNYSGMESTTYLIKFTANGPLDQLVTNLSSDPILDNSDIIALLTLGATRTQLTGGGEGGESTGDVLTERAKTLASEKLSGIISKKAGGFLGLDQVTVTGNLLDFSDSWGPGLVLSKKISNRTSVTYSTNVGHMNDQSFRVDYKLTPQFSLEGETNQGGNSSLSFKYGIRFP